MRKTTLVSLLFVLSAVLSPIGAATPRGTGAAAPASSVTLAAGGTWIATGQMATAREYHTQTLLRDGRVLVTGGGHFGYLASCEIYDPASRSWTPTGSLHRGRWAHTATLLGDGRVLVVGESRGGTRAETYDLRMGTWTVTGAMSEPDRVNHTATRLPDGRVLVAGGVHFYAPGGDVVFSSAEVFDPATDTWSAVRPMSVPRQTHSATLLDDGRVLVAGGCSMVTHATSEIYDPATDSWAATGAMAFARMIHNAELLRDGRVLVAGGGGAMPGALASVQIYDPGTGTWSTAASMSQARSSGHSALLSNGQVLVAGGWGGPYLSSAEVYDPATDAWSPAGDMSTERSNTTATVLADGSVLVSGGHSKAATRERSADLFVPILSVDLISVPQAGWSQPGQLCQIAAAYHDPDGWDDLRYLDFMVNTWDAPTRCLAARYDVQNDCLQLHHVSRDRWIPIGGKAPGATGDIHQIYGAVDVERCQVFTSTDTISVTWSVTPTWRMSGKLHNIYLRVEDMSGNSTGWSDEGDWAVNRTPNWLIAPDLRNTTISVQDKHWFYPKYRDLDKRDNLDVLHFFIGDELPVIGKPMPDGVWLKYDRTEDKMCLWDPRYDFWVGPQTPQTAFRMTNPYVTVRGPGSRVIGCDFQTLGVKWYLQFKPAFLGRHRLYMRAVDVLTGAFGGDTGWKWKGWIEIVE